MRCAVYGRVSLEDQVEQYGLASQLRALRAYAETKGYAVVEESIDEGYSGADLDRPGLAKIRTMARTGQLDVVIAYDPDRLSRKLAHLEIVREDLERAEVRLEFVTARSGDTPEDRMLMNLRGMFSEYEREKIRERTLRGRREKAKQGYIVGGRTLFGYQYLGRAAGERGRLVVDEEKAAIVRKMFEWAASGDSIRAITARLNELNIAPTFAARWGKSSVGRVLKNQTYTGVAHYGRRKRCEPRNPTAEHRRRRNKRTLLRERPESEWISVPTPAIISRDLFDRVALRLTRNKVEWSGRKSRRYLLRGLLWCGCGLKMAGDPNHGTPCYRCAGRDKLRRVFDRCQQRANASKLDTAVWKAVCEPFQNEAALRSVIERNRETFQKPKVDVIELQKRIDVLKVRESRGVQALFDLEGEHQVMMRVTLRGIAEERRKLQAELAEAQTEVVGVQSDMIGLLCREFLNRVSEFDAQEQQDFLRRVVERVVLNGRDVTISCAIPVAQTAHNMSTLWPVSSARMSFILKAKVA